jgi:hypothetical protein
VEALVGRLVITERTLAQTVEAIEQGGVDEIAALLREPEVQARVAAAVNDGLEELLDRPVRDLLGDVTPERAERLRNALVERVLYLFRHPTTEEVLLAGSTAARRGRFAERRSARRARPARRGARGGAHRPRGDWVVETLRGPRALASCAPPSHRDGVDALRSASAGSATTCPPTRCAAPRAPVRPALGLPPGAGPDRRRGLPVAQMVEDKLKSYPISKVEELIWRVSRNELVLIIYLGGFLGALIGSLMLFTRAGPPGCWRRHLPPALLRLHQPEGVGRRAPPRDRRHAALRVNRPVVALFGGEDATNTS